jgi:hypothetical protein
MLREYSSAQRSQTPASFSRSIGFSGARRQQIA